MNNTGMVSNGDENQFDLIYPNLLHR